MDGGKVQDMYKEILRLKTEAPVSCAAALGRLQQRCNEAGAINPTMWALVFDEEESTESSRSRSESSVIGQAQRDKLLYSSIFLGSHSPMSKASVSTSARRRIHADFLTAPRLCATNTVDAESM